jgi:hypothetical protein
LTKTTTVTAPKAENSQKADPTNKPNVEQPNYAGFMPVSVPFDANILLNSSPNLIKTCEDLYGKATANFLRLEMMRVLKASPLHAEIMQPSIVHSKTSESRILT